MGILAEVSFLAMTFLWLFMVLLLFGPFATGSPTPTRFEARSGIVGGQEAEPHQFPWQISLKYLDIWPHHSHRCGATIVDSLHIVCAAHCIQGTTKGWFQVVAGAHDIKIPWPGSEDSVQKRGVAEMWQHEGFDPYIFSNDVSLLKLDEPLEFNEYVQPLPLAAQGDDPAGGTICINSGWGSTSDSQYPVMPNNLQYVEMPVVPRPDCQEDYSEVNNVDDGMICAGVDQGGAGACSGDSGGPFVCPNQNGTLQLSGIVSWGVIPCAQSSFPSVYTNVGYFRDWIDEHLAL